LGLGRRPAQVVQQRRHEERDALHGDVDEEEAKGAEVVCDVEHGAFHMAGPGLFLVGTAALDKKTSCSDDALALSEEPAVPRRWRHKERRRNADDDGQEALEEEYVAPCVDPHRVDAPFGDASQADGFYG